MCLKTFIPINYYLSPKTLIDILIYKKCSKMYKNFNQSKNKIIHKKKCYLNV